MKTGSIRSAVCVRALAYGWYSPIIWIHVLPVWHEAGRAVIQEGAEVNSIVPVGGEVLDFAVRQDGLQPGQHQLLRGEVGGAQLVMGNQGPCQPQYQLQVAIVYVGIS